MLLKKLLYKWLLPKFISKACPSRISRSGEKGKSVNCYYVKLDNSDSTPFFVATGYNCGKLLGLKWDGNSYKDEHSLELADLEAGKLRITHYYGLAEIEYDSIYDATWHYLTKFIYLKIKIDQYIESVDQKLFNKRKLFIADRIKLLQAMINYQLEPDYDDGLDDIELMAELYSIKWVSHPDSNNAQRKLKCNIRWLIDLGELKETDSKYVVTGLGIATIEKYLKEEERHKDGVKLQNRLVLITAFLVIVGLVQAGVGLVQAEVIKLPIWLIKLLTWFDLYNK
jgi:hypothetical protein